MLVNGPRKLIIEFPCNKCKAHCSNSNQDWDCNQVGLYLWPQQLTFNEVTWALLLVQIEHSLLNLLDLYRRVDQHAKVIKTQSNDLNRILETQGIINENELIYEAEDKECEVRRDDLCFGDWRQARGESHLEPCEHIGFQGQYDYGLKDGDYHESPCPQSIGFVHGESGTSRGGYFLLAFGLVWAVIQVFC